MRAAVAAMALALAVAGCGAAPTRDVAHVADTFYRALSGHDGRLACEQLAPQTRHEVVQSAQAPCRAAILQEDIPNQGRVRDVEQFGNQAQVRAHGDTAFLAQFPDGWKITAVGCSPRRPLPYNCEVTS